MRYRIDAAGQEAGAVFGRGASISDWLPLAVCSSGSEITCWMLGAALSRRRQVAGPVPGNRPASQWLRACVMHSRRCRRRPPGLSPFLPFFRMRCLAPLALLITPTTTLRMLLLPCLPRIKQPRLHVTLTGPAASIPCMLASTCVLPASSHKHYPTPQHLPCMLCLCLRATVRTYVFVLNPAQWYVRTYVLA